MKIEYESNRCYVVILMNVSLSIHIGFINLKCNERTFKRSTLIWPTKSFPRSFLQRRATLKSMQANKSRNWKIKEHHDHLVRSWKRYTYKVALLLFSPLKSSTRWKTLQSHALFLLPTFLVRYIIFKSKIWTNVKSEHLKVTKNFSCILDARFEDFML